MEYIVIIEPNTADASFISDSHGFIEKYNSYEDAKEAADDFKNIEGCSQCEVFTLCTKERNHLI